jgi:hypothetical protein
MGIKVTWDNEDHSAIRYDYEGKWTWNDLYEAVKECHRLLDSVNYKVDSIIDLEHSSLLPENALSHGQSVVKMSHPNQGIMIVVGANALVRSLLDIYKRIYVKNTPPVLVARTMAEARETVQRRRAVPGS